jgi:hypothetical protein
VRLEIQETNPKIEIYLPVLVRYSFVVLDNRYPGA